jgi:tRNA threonylcarbamoyladenosine biosynthesis protein TsaB
MGWHLAIETSQRCGGLAIRTDAGVVHHAELTSKGGLDDLLMPELDRLATLTQCTPKALALVGVSIGPGGFTGLRIAVATAQMLAETTGCALVAVPTALASVRATGRSAGSVAVALASKNDTTWLSIIDAGSQQVMQAGLADSTTAEAWLQGVDLLLGDDHLPGPITDLAKRLGIPIEVPIFDATACLGVAEAMCAAGICVDATTLRPLYPRVPEAVTRFDARQ